MKKAVVLLLAGLLLGCSAPSRQTPFKVVVLGFDGVDPDLVELWLSDLPNIERLAESGTLTQLGSTNPPESPVAWATFATGTNPGKHGIFDFLRRDPETYFPDIGLVHREKPVFLFSIPVRGPVIVNNRQGTPFWKHLDEAGISTVNLRTPLEFPPVELEHGKTLSGLGLPDVRGTWGTYFYLASDLSQWDLADTEFGGRQVKLELEGNHASFEIDGPVDPRRDDFQRIKVPAEIELDEASGAVTLRLGDQAVTASENQWSDWIRFEFPIGPFVSIHGISRFYVLETYPEVRLYLMPIGLDPSQPSIPFSTPSDFTEQLAENHGLFKTLGWIHETWGLNEEQIDEAVFLEDLFRNMDALETNLLDQIKGGDASLYSAVFTATDSAAHMLFRLIDPDHPRYDAALAERFGDSLKQVYQRMDSVIGKVSQLLGPEDILIVVSDHGFHTWRKEFNTNTWLVRNGFMTLEGMDTDEDLRKLDQMFSGGSFFPNVDWSRTKAYALGLGQIYVNLKGRESKGIVEPGPEYDSLIREIRDRILEFRDPDTDELVLQNGYFRDEIYSGPEISHAGDIQLSFRTGYRTSWQTSLGAVPESIVVANLKKWSGDHCASDVSDTSGFLVSNRVISAAQPAIADVAPTLYQVFGVEIPSWVDGTAWQLERK